MWLVGAPGDAACGAPAGDRHARADDGDAPRLVPHRRRLQGAGRQGGPGLRPGPVPGRPVRARSSPRRSASAMRGLRGLHRRAAACFAVVLAGYALAIYVITDAARTHQIGLRALAIMLPMLAVTAAVGSVSYDDITLAQSMFGLPDADRLEQDLLPPPDRALAPASASADPGTTPPPREPRDACGSRASGSTTFAGHGRPRRGARRAGRGRPRTARRHLHRARRRQRRGQVHAGQPARPAPRPDRRPDHRGRRRTCASSTRPAGSGRSR